MMKTVVAGIVKCHEKILIAQRKKEKSLGLYWEFPGGKLEENESLEEALKREFIEEFGKEIKVGKFFMESIYNYDFGSIKLVAFFASADNFEIDFHIDHEEVQWVYAQDLKHYNFAPADISFVKALDA